MKKLSLILPFFSLFLTHAELGHAVEIPIGGRECFHTFHKEPLKQGEVFANCKNMVLEGLCNFSLIETSTGLIGLCFSPYLEAYALGYNLYCSVDNWNKGIHLGETYRLMYLLQSVIDEYNRLDNGELLKIIDRTNVMRHLYGEDIVPLKSYKTLINSAEYKIVKNVLEQKYIQKRRELNSTELSPDEIQDIKLEFATFSDVQITKSLIFIYWNTSIGFCSSQNGIPKTFKLNSLEKIDWHIFIDPLNNEETLETHAPLGSSSSLYNSRSGSNSNLLF